MAILSAVSNDLSCYCRNTRVLAVAFALFVAGLGRGVEAQDEEAKVLALPTSPGAIARLVEFPQSAEARVRLSRALLDASSEVRAAAARVVFVTANVTLLPQVAIALGQETDSDALLEQMRALARFGSPDQDPSILDAWERGSSRSPVLVYAAARGPSALSAFRRVAARSPDDVLTSDFVRVALKGDATAIAEVGARAVRDSDRDLFSASLRAVREVAGAAPPQLIVEALQAPADSGIGIAALWDTLRDWFVERPALHETVRDAIAAFLDRPTPDAADARAVLARELAARYIGRSPRTDDAWAALLATRSAEVRRYIGFTSLRVLLTDQEFVQLATANERDPKSFAPLRLMSPEQMRALKMSSSPAQQTTGLFVASDYPRGFVRSVFSTAECNPRGSDARAGSAELVMRGDGRVAKVRLVEASAPRGCNAAARTLFMTYVPAPNRPAREGETGHVVVPFSTDYVTCQDSLPPEQAQRSVGGEVVPPKKIRDVRPVYPQEMQAKRISGAVVMEGIITTTGCVRGARIVRAVHPQLDWAAIRAVLGWRFTPTLFGGAPAEVRVSVTVNFTLN